LLCGFFAAVSRPLLATSFSLGDLRLFVIKRIFLLSATLCSIAEKQQCIKAIEEPEPR
jgi:hypothetical protein